MSKRHLHSHVHLSTIHNTKIWNKIKCPSVGEWIKKMWYVEYLHNGIVYSLQKEGNSIILDHMDGDTILSEISQAQKENFSMISLIYAS
jgi:hypothetical protein